MKSMVAVEVVYRDGERVRYGSWAHGLSAAWANVQLELFEDWVYKSLGGMSDRQLRYGRKRKGK